MRLLVLTFGYVISGLLIAVGLLGFIWQNHADARDQESTAAGTPPASVTRTPDARDYKADSAQIKEVNERGRAAGTVTGLSKQRNAEVIAFSGAVLGIAFSIVAIWWSPSLDKDNAHDQRRVTRHTTSSASVQDRRRQRPAAASTEP
jgi:hypothetical protein